MAKKSDDNTSTLAILAAVVLIASIPGLRSCVLGHKPDTNTQAVTAVFKQWVTPIEFETTTGERIKVAGVSASCGATPLAVIPENTEIVGDTQTIAGIPLADILVTAGVAVKGEIPPCQ